MEEYRRYLAYHHGVVTMAKAKDLGLTEGQLRYRLTTGRLVRVAPGVVRSTSAPDSWAARARTAALAVRGLVSHGSGLVVWQVDDQHPRETVHVLTAHDHRPHIPWAVVHRLGAGPDPDGRLIDGIPVTGPTRTVIDSAAVLTAIELDATIDAVIRQGLTTLSELTIAVEETGTRGRKGLGVLRRLLAERDPAAAVPDSRFNRLMGQLLVAAGLPEPCYEWPIQHQDRTVARADLAYPAERLAIECDSHRWHRNRQSFVADPRRRNQIIMAGYEVLNFTWDRLPEPPSGDRPNRQSTTQ